MDATADGGPGDTALHLGRNIQTLREARGVTQQQIARVAGVPRATWANLESGAANPTLEAGYREAWHKPPQARRAA